MRSVYSINKGWKFEKIKSEVDPIGYRVESDEVVHVPHTWNMDGNTERGRFAYQKTLQIPDQHKNEEVFLEFLGANSVCEVYLNHTFIGEHRGGYATFRFHITEFYDWEIENVLTVYVDNRPTEDVSPLFGDFTIYGGLYRDVNLICTDKSHFDLGYWGSQGIIIRSEVNQDGTGNVNLEIHTVGASDKSIALRIIDNNGILVQSEDVLGSQEHVQIRMDQPVLWNGKANPYRYTLIATLRDDRKICDEVRMNFGFRKCQLDAGRGFFLNDHHVRINGVAKHQDYEGIGNAVTEAHIRKDFDLIQDIGANAVRLSHYQHPQLAYDLCDEQGLIVWAEIPMMSMPDDEKVLRNASDQLRELILQNCHHPSICFWGIQNEIAMGGESLEMYHKVNRLNDLVKDLLPDSITASANMYHVKNNSQLNFITDLLGYNLYYGWYYGEMGDLDSWMDGFHSENPQVSLGISEYGADSNLSFHSDQPKVKDYSEEFQALYHEVTYPIIHSKAYLWGSFVWNMFDFGSHVRDEGGSKGKNCKGLVSFDRTIRKDAFYLYKSFWSKEPFIHICEKRFRNRHKENMEIKVYSNLGSVSLHVNGNEIGMLEGENVFVFREVPLEHGDNHIKVSAGNIEDHTVFIRTHSADQSYVFVDTNPAINVKNWFVQEKGEIDLFPENSYSILDTLGTLMENEEAWAIVKKMAPKIAERAVPGAPVTFLWVANKMRSILSENEVKEINQMLIKITKNNQE